MQLPRVLYIAQSHRLHDILHTFEQLGELHMNKHANITTGLQAGMPQPDYMQTVRPPEVAPGHNTGF